ncbi:P-type DNA transfer ATPase VirB11 [uncultured Roseibium sp.]|uniref:P-type DNA transfer ATPase VirB11 n=1 Tax=uncultured Roseibium sp. TaxID=1936171 RepID=UPI0026389150|nr:P-type DNA transfer ATPase VirB11 [uncultured Roseibium sp.]
MKNFIPDIPASYVEQYLAPIKDYLVDDQINEIVINPNRTIFIERAKAHAMEQIDVCFPEHAVNQLGAQLAGETKNALGRHHPIVSGRVFVWGEPLRVQVVVEPAVEEGVSLSIRKYVTQILTTREVAFVSGKQLKVQDERTRKHRALQDLAEAGDLPALLKTVIEERYNILISGGTSSGKTTLARALLAICDEDERILTIEDAQELRPLHKNYVALVADRRPNSEQLPSKLLESALRMRPDRIILGEIRGVEAYDFLETINTGHPGSISTIHADSPELAFERLALMVMRSGVQLSHAEVIRYAQRTIDLVIQVGRRNGQRGILEVYLPALQE